MSNAASTVSPITPDTELADLFDKHYDADDTPSARMLMSLGMQGWKTIQNMVENPNWVERLRSDGWDELDVGRLITRLEKAGILSPFTEELARSVLGVDDQAVRIADFLCGMRNGHPHARLRQFLEVTGQRTNLPLVLRIEQTETWQKTEAPSLLHEYAIEDLNLSKGARAALHKLKIRMTSDAIKNPVRASDIINLPGCGVSTAVRICKAFREANLPFIDDARLHIT